MWLLVVGGVLLLLALLAILPLGVRLVYEEDLVLYAYIWRIRIRLIPRRDKRERLCQHTPRARARRERREARRAARKERRLARHRAEHEAVSEKKVARKKRTLVQTASFVRQIGTLVCKLLVKFSGYAKLKMARLILIIGTGDAAETAKLYGIAQVGVYNMIGLLEEYVTVAKAEKEICVKADFLAESSEALCDICLQMRVWQVLILGAKALFGFLRLKGAGDKRQTT